MNKKQAMAITFVSVLLFSALAGLQLVNLAWANPYIRKWVEEGEVSPPNGTQPPTILILSPENDKVYSSNNVSLTVNVSIPESNNVSLRINKIYYRASWQQLRNTYVDLKTLNYTLPQLSINLTDVPEGPRWLEVYATAKGFSHETRQEFSGHFLITYYVSYKITGSSVVNFTIDTTPPTISALSVENKTYYTSDVPLNLIVNEPVSQITYSLDRQTNVTITGNTTLTDLSDGSHSLTVYAKDTAGNIGASENVYFGIEVPPPEPPQSESFPTTLIAATTVTAAIAMVGATVLVSFAKVKQPLLYEVDLTKIQGKGEFPCRNCGVIISPEDETEDLYCILEVKVKDETLEEIVIQCNNCGSRIQLVGFLILDSDNT